MGEAARVRADGCFARERVVGAYEELYRRVVG
jgi:hypothetical protein